MEEINNNSQNDNLNQNKTEKEQKTVIKVSNPLLSKLIPIIAIVIIVGFAFMFINKKTSVKTTVVSIMQSEKTISQLSALKVPYGGIYIEKDDKDNEINRHLYRGNIVYSVNFKGIKISEVDKTINVNVPKVEIKSENIYIDPVVKSLKNTKYSNSQLIEICKEDCLSQFDNDKELMELANESVKGTLKNFLEPILKSIDGSYNIVVNIVR